MIGATAILLVSIAASGSDPGRAAVEEALRSLDSRLAVLEGLQARRAMGDRISLDTLRSAPHPPSDAEEVLARERAAVEDLRDAIRVARETRRPDATEPAAEEPRGEAAPEPDPAPSVESVTLPRTGPLALRAAEARYRAGDFAGALALLDEAAQNASTWARLRRGRCLERLGRRDEARAAYEALLRDHPEDRWAEAARWSLQVLDLASSGDGKETAR